MQRSTMHWSSLQSQHFTEIVFKAAIIYSTTNDILIKRVIKLFSVHFLNHKNFTNANGSSVEIHVNLSIYHRLLGVMTSRNCDCVECVDKFTLSATGMQVIVNDKTTFIFLVIFFCYRIRDVVDYT